MTDVKLIDVSLRDGNQSVWGATGVTDRTVREMAPLLERCGYEALELLTSTIIAVAVRYHKQDRHERAKNPCPSARVLRVVDRGSRFTHLWRSGNDGRGGVAASSTSPPRRRKRSQPMMPPSQ